MSNNLIRKGLAIGTALAISLTGLAAAPANADSAGLVTLTPAAGTTYNSIKGSGIDLKSTVDADSTPNSLAFLISNPSKSALTVKGKVISGSTAESLDAVELVNGALVTGTDLNAANDATAISTSSFVVRSYDGTNGSFDATEYLHIDSTKKTVDVTFTVTAWLDKDRDGAIDASEQAFASKPETVTLFDTSSLTATAKLDVDALEIGTGANYVDVTLNKDINHSQIANSSYAVALLKGGADIDLASASKTSTETVDSLGADVVYVNYSSSRGTLAALIRPATSLDADDTWSAGNYQVRAALVTATSADDYTWAGPASATVALAVGGESLVNAIRSTVTDAKNAIFTKDTSLSGGNTLTIGSWDDVNATRVRNGVKDVTFVAQALQADTSSANAATDTNDDLDVLESATVRVKAIVTAKKLADGSKITVAGSTAVLDAAGEKTTVFGTTDAAGKFSLVVSTAGATTSDTYTVEFFYLNTSGAWVTNADVTKAGDFGASATYVAYEAATVPASTGFTTPLSNVSGDTVSVTFNVADQFGQALSADANGAFGVYLVDSQSSTTFKSTVAVVAGKATFSFKNYVAKGGNATLNATLFNGTVYASDAAVSNGTASVSLFNNEATGSVTATSSISNEVTYEDFFSGNVTTNTDLTALSTAVSVDATITGRVADVNGAAQAGAVVTVSGAGLQFRNGDDFAKDKITFNAASDGTYTVHVWSHVANSTGVKITSTADGKTATTTLKTYLPSSVDVADNLAFSIKLPAFLVKNTTYTVTAKLTDKWNNPIKTATNGSTYGVSFVGTGSVEVNGKDTAVGKNFDKNGNVTVYVRSVKDVAGPGSITATLGAANYTATSGATADVLPIAQQTTDDKTTAWDETVFVNEISTDVEMLDKKPAASIKKAATSTVVVKYATGLTIKVARGSKSVTKVATSSSQKITLKGGSGKVKVYVNGSLVASK